VSDSLEMVFQMMRKGDQCTRSTINIMTLLCLFATYTRNSYSVTAFSAFRPVGLRFASSSNHLWERATFLKSTSTSEDVLTKVPVTILSGFLGSGKTTALKHLLENREGIKVGVVVNDVASVNIDAKLIIGGSESDGSIQLQNGCACCSLADELLVSLNTLLENQAAKDSSFDAVVVELSGVADPVSVKNNWNEAIAVSFPDFKGCHFYIFDH